MLELTAENFQKHSLHSNYSERGGSIVIDLTPFGVDGEQMVVYQNYLGGGMLGRISTNCTFYEKQKKVTKGFKEKMQTILEIEVALKKYFHSLTNHVGDEWEEESFEQNQNKPISAY